MEPREIAAALGAWDTTGRPLYDALAAALEGLIGRGAIPPGSRLPSERRLASALAVSRGTVVSAYESLRGRGVVQTRHGSGTTVAGRAPAVQGIETACVETLLAPNVVSAGGFDGDVIDLRPAAWPSIDPIDPDAFTLSRHDLGDTVDHHGYHPAGLPRLRDAIARHLTDRGLTTVPEQVLVTGGAQQAIHLATRMVLSPGDSVAVEEITYPGAHDVFLAAGTRVHGVPVGRDGVDLDSLDRTVRERRARLVYLIPTLQNPTGVVMPDSVRRDLAARIAGWDAIVVDDEAILELYLDAESDPVTPVAAFAQDATAAGRILTLGSAAKSFWGGLRIGWVRGPEPLIAQMTRLKVLDDIGSPVLDQLVTAKLLDRADEIRTARHRALHERIAVLRSALAEHLPEWSWTPPRGGLSAWISLPEPLGPALAEAGLRHGVAVTAGTISSVDGAARDSIRMSMGAAPDDLALGVERLAAAWRSLVGTPTSGQRLGVVV